MITALLAIIAIGTAPEECPIALDLTGPKVARGVQPYADCMSQPHLPTSSTLKARKMECVAKLASGNEADPTVAWVDYIAANFPGCETRLRIIRK